MTILSKVKTLGQHIWLDNLSRSLVRNGGLEAMLQQGISGVTSNPAIFQKAFASDPLYTAEIAALKQQGFDAKKIYETLAVADVQAACDVFRKEFEADGNAGFVSLEVAPELACDADGTIAEARRLFAAIGRPNVMIKLPATDAGIAALETLVSDGININLTLLFSRKQTLEAYAAYERGLRSRLQQCLPVAGIRMVASFFISRIDSALDITLPARLQGQTAIALAKAAYLDWQDHFGRAEFSELADAGAQRPRLLWASTGVKNPDYPDTLYIDRLIGAETVNTVPEAALNAFADHGTATPTLSENTEAALAVLEEIAALGIDLEVLAIRLQRDGLQQFEEAFKQLLALLN